MGQRCNSCRYNSNRCRCRCRCSEQRRAGEGLAHAAHSTEASPSTGELEDGSLIFGKLSLSINIPCFFFVCSLLLRFLFILLWSFLRLLTRLLLLSCLIFTSIVLRSSLILTVSSITLPSLSLSLSLFHIFITFRASHDWFSSSSLIPPPFDAL